MIVPEEIEKLKDLQYVKSILENNYANYYEMVYKLLKSNKKELYKFFIDNDLLALTDLLMSDTEKNCYMKARNIAILDIVMNYPTTIIKIELKDGLVDDFDVQIILKNADEASWNKQYSKEVKEKRLENLELVLNSEGVLHTVIFKPCCEEYAYTIVKWYAISRITHVVGVPGIGGLVHYSSPKTMSNTFIEECKISDKFYCNNECAFNVAVEVSQYDKNGKKLISLSEGFKD